MAGKNKNDRIDSEKLCHCCATNLIPPAYVYPAEKRPLRALLRQRLLYVWNRSELLSRIQFPSTGLQPAHLPPDALQPGSPGANNSSRRSEHGSASSPCKNDLALIGHYDAQLASLEKELLKLTRQTASRDFTLLQTTPGIGDYIGLTILTRDWQHRPLPTVKDFLSYCRLVKGTVASAGKIKGLRGAKLGNPICAGPLGRRRWWPNAMPSWTFGSTARSADGRQQVQKPTPSWHQAGPRRLFHAQKTKRSSDPDGWWPL